HTIGLSCKPESDLQPLADLAITPVVGPEVLSGSTRLKAGTATKLVLNMLSTGTMVRLGKCFGNLMVDLRATNSKLRARTNRIVRQLTGLDTEAADALLKSCGGELKIALVAHLARLSPIDARNRLHEAGGRGSRGDSQLGREERHRENGRGRHRCGAGASGRHARHVRGCTGRGYGFDRIRPRVRWSKCARGGLGLPLWRRRQRLFTSRGRF